MTAVGGLALRDNPVIRHDFPSHRQLRGSRKLGPRGQPGPDHDRTADQRARGLRRQGIEDDFQGGRVRHTAVTLTVHEFGLDSQAF